jgi:hypothetical protein
MKKVLYILLSALILSSCGSSKKQLQQGNYDAAIQKAVKKLMRNPDSEKDIEVLDRSYKLANERDLERIKYLRLEGKPENWEEIVQLYERLKQRQQTVRIVLPLELNGRTINYAFTDYDQEIVDAKHNAAEFFFAHGQKLMANNDKESYRQAYYEFLKVKEYWGDYENIDNLLNESRYLGMSRALVTVHNLSQLNLSEAFKNELLAVSPQDLQTEWVEYYASNLDENVQFDYEIRINLKVIAVSPEGIKESDRTVKKRVEDGFEYVLDANGNVMKDTAGNDIKLVKYKDLTCTVIETQQSKSAHLEGDVEIYTLDPVKLLRKDPIGADSHFEHFSARAVGEVNALSPEDQELVKQEPLPFPDDGEMIMRTTESLKMAIRAILQRNRSYIY